MYNSWPNVGCSWLQTIDASDIAGAALGRIYSALDHISNVYHSLVWAKYSILWIPLILY